MFSLALAGEHRGAGEIVGLCDANAGRLEHRMGWARGAGLDARGYDADHFDTMLDECRPDCVIVATPDWTHDAFICSAIEHGCAVITEKPLSIDAERCRRILRTQRDTGRSCRVTFNYRYSPPRSQVKQLLQSGVIGDIHSAEFSWLLDTTHGADYFRRWHRRREYSGGLLVHKATHHFDLVNWWLDSVPERVQAQASRRFYTPERAREYGLQNRGERCLDCADADRCPFFLDLRARKELDAIYRRHEAHDGYHRDQCVFSGDIDIFDSMSVGVRYASGVLLTYSLTAFSPWEGYAIAFNGSRGRLEHRMVESTGGDVPGSGATHDTTIRVLPHFEPGYDVAIERGEGMHGGGDARLLADLFSSGPAEDPLGRAADHRAGAWSVLTGVAANTSIDSGQAVQVAALAEGLL